jgi:hypothetical protein
MFIEESTLFNSQSTVDLFRLLDRMAPLTSRPRIVSFISHASSSVSAHQMSTLLEMAHAQAFRVAKATTTTTTTRSSSSSLRIKFKTVHSKMNTKFVSLLQEFMRPFVAYLDIPFACGGDLTSHRALLLDAHIRHTILNERDLHQRHKRFCVAHLTLEMLDSLEIGNLLGARRSCAHLKSYLNRKIVENKFTPIWSKKETGKMVDLVEQLNSLAGSEAEARSASSKYEALVGILCAEEEEDEEKKNEEPKTIVYVRNLR